MVYAGGVNSSTEVIFASLNGAKRKQNHERRGRSKLQNAERGTPSHEHDLCIWKTHNWSKRPHTAEQPSLVQAEL